MKLRAMAMLLLLSVSLPAAGCRRNQHLDAYMELLNAEKRSLEDQVYELEYDYEQKLAELDVCQQENRQLREQLGRPARAAEQPPLEPPPDPDEPPRFEPDDPLDFAPPRIEPGVPIEPPSELPMPVRSERPRSDGLRPAQSGHHETLAAKPVDQRVTQIALDLPPTGDPHGQPAADLLSLVIQPRNAAGDYLPQAGRVTIVALDPAQTGDAARVARWEFSSSEVGRQLQSGSSQRPGAHFHLLWPEPPSHSRLHLFVRYHTQDGRQLEADREISVALATRYSTRWTPRAQSGVTSQPVNVARQPAAPRDPSPVADQPPDDPPSDDAHPDQDNEDPPAPEAETASTTTPERPLWQPFR